MSRTPIPRRPWLLVLLIAFATPARASTTLMILVDWWTPSQMDTILNLKVFQPASEIKMVDGSVVPDPVATKAFTTEFRSWWYALPNFDAEAYVQGRIRFNTQYYRGWFQNDSTFRALAGDTIFLPDTQKTFIYSNAVSGVVKVAILQAESPKFFVFDSAGFYRGPKLYTSAGNAGTEVLNQRTLGAGGLPVSGTGRLDKCIDTLKSDTVWIRWGTPSSPPGQMPTAAGMKCFGQNPFVTPTTSTISLPRQTYPSTGMELATERDLLVLPGGKWDISGRNRLP